MKEIKNVLSKEATRKVCRILFNFSLQVMEKECNGLEYFNKKKESLFKRIHKIITITTLGIHKEGEFLEVVFVKNGIEYLCHVGFWNGGNGRLYVFKLTKEIKRKYVINPNIERYDVSDYYNTLFIDTIKN